MPALRNFIFISTIIFLSVSASAQSIVIRNAREAPTPIAIQAFVSGAAQNSAAATDIEAALTADLIFSRIFKVIPADAFLESKIVGNLNEFKVDSWKQVGAQYVVRGRVTVEAGMTSLEAFVFDVNTGRAKIQKTYKTKRSDKEILAHEFGDDIVEIVTGQKGLFSTKITFVYVPVNSHSKEIWISDFNGKNPRPIVQNGRTNISPEWTLDGRYIYYSSSSLVDWHLWKTDLNGHQTQITHFKGSALGPAMMPNGREMLISLSKDGNPDIYLMALDGNIKRRLTMKRGINIAPASSPDGKHACFSSDRLGNLHIFVLDMNTLDATRATRVGTLNDTCTWNPIDNTILFAGMDTDREFDIFAMNDKGEEMERLTYDANFNENPYWSPDGKLVVMSSKRINKMNKIFVMKADGTQVSQLIDLPGEASQPAWSQRLGY